MYVNRHESITTNAVIEWSLDNNSSHIILLLRRRVLFNQLTTHFDVGGEIGILHTPDLDGEG